jgi:DNA-3-methyladenine glycosylase
VTAPTPVEGARAFDRPLPREFFARDTVRVARELLGATLVHRTRDEFRAVRIVETEAYLGRSDPASHSYRGETKRNRSMFGPPGHLYVFPIHQVVCANVVTQNAEAVLLRAGEPLDDALPNPSGPGRLCRALGIHRAHDGLDLLTSEVRLAKGRRPDSPIAVGRRVGISRGTEAPLRFALRDNRWVSRPWP